MNENHLFINNRQVCRNNIRKVYLYSLSQFSNKIISFVISFDNYLDTEL